MLCEGSYLKAVAHSKSDDNGDILSAVRSHYYCRPIHQQLLASSFFVFAGVKTGSIYRWAVSRPVFMCNKCRSMLTRGLLKIVDLAIQARLFTSRLCWYFLPQHGRTWRHHLMIVVFVGSGISNGCNGFVCHQILSEPPR